MRRFLIPAALAIVAVSAAPAFALNGVTPISPKRGDTVPVGKSPTFKMKVVGDHTGVFVHVCKSKRKDDDGMICNDELIGKAKKKRGTRYQLKPRFFDFPEFWLNSPGTYYWQAYRTACDAGLDDCKAEGPVVRFKVA
jgi:hypothetical protein